MKQLRLMMAATYANLRTPQIDPTLALAFLRLRNANSICGVVLLLQGNLGDWL
jgi:hypothetical protein